MSFATVAVWRRTVRAENASKSKKAERTLPFSFTFCLKKLCLFLLVDRKAECYLSL